MTTYQVKRVSDTLVLLTVNLPYQREGSQRVRYEITSRFKAYRVLTELVDEHKDNGCGLFPEEVLLLWRDISSCFVWGTTPETKGLRYYHDFDLPVLTERKYYEDGMSSLELKNQLKSFFQLFEQRLLEEIAQRKMKKVESAGKKHNQGHAPTQGSMAPEVPVGANH